MTATGSCHKCGKAAYQFHYTRPRKDAFDTHEGFWHCEDHGPVEHSTVSISEPPKPKFAPHLNRAARRKLLKARGRK